MFTFHVQYQTEDFGLIYIETSDGYFPGEIWDDFIDFILYEWLINANTLFQEKHSVFKFMEGAYEFHVDRIDDTLCTIGFFSTNNIQHLPETTHMPSVVIDFHHFVQELIMIGKLSKDDGVHALVDALISRVS